MENPRPEKVAVVDEVRAKLEAVVAAVLTEYRGLNVSATADLRRALRDAGGEYKIYKNTLVRIAARDLGLEIDDLLTGPTAIAFVTGDAVGVAKALQDFAKTNPALVVKGGLLGDQVLERGGHQGPRRPRAPRGAARQVRRPARCSDAAVRRPPRGPAPQLRLRPQGPHRPGRRPGAPADAPAPAAEEAPAAEPDAEAAHRGEADAPAEDTAADAADAAAADSTPTPTRPSRPTPKGELTMATQEEILDSIANLSVLELSELLKAFEEKFGVTAAAPAVAVAAAGGGGVPLPRRRAGRVRRDPHRCR